MSWIKVSNKNLVEENRRLKKELLAANKLIELLTKYRLFVVEKCRCDGEEKRKLEGETCERFNNVEVAEIGCRRRDGGDGPKLSENHSLKQKGDEQSDEESTKKSEGDEVSENEFEGGTEKANASGMTKRPGSRSEGEEEEAKRETRRACDNMKFKKVTGSDGELRFQCVLCEDGQSYKTISIFRQHFKRRHAKKVYHCTERNCSAKFATKTQLNYHFNRHKGIKPFKCDWSGCEYSAVTKDQLKQHLLNHSGEKRFACDYQQCTFRTFTLQRLKVHRLIHENNKTFKCCWPGCDFRGITNGAVLDHAKSHEEKRFECSWPGCTTRCPKKSVLDKHVAAVHFGVKKYKCDWPGCEYKSNNLKTHRLVHTKENNFICTWPECVKRYRHKKALERHLLIHRGEKPFKCQFAGCEMRFVEQGNMRKHMRVHEKNSPAVRRSRVVKENSGQ